MVLFRRLRSDLEGAGHARPGIDRREGHEPQSDRMDPPDQRGPGLLHGHGPHEGKLFGALLPPARRQWTRLGAEAPVIGRLLLALLLASGAAPVAADTLLLKPARVF